MEKKENEQQANVSVVGTDIFGNLAELRKRQDFDKIVSVSRSLTSVPVAKPGKQMWFRVHPGEEYKLPGALLKWEDDGTEFYVKPDIYPDLSNEVRLVELRLVVTPQASPRLWPIPLPKADGTDNSWHQSARAAAARAEHEWIRMASNREVSGYEVSVAGTDFGEPQWPSQSFGDLLKIAFSGKVIDSIDHPVVQRLLGRAR